MEYKILSHTSEIGIEAYGKDIGEAFASAARAMFSIIVDLKTIAAQNVTRIEMQSPSKEELLVDFLNELLFYFETEQMLFGHFEVRIKDNTLKAKAEGEKLNQTKHYLKTQIKGTTYYDLQVNTNGKNRVRAFFDV